MSKIMSCPNCGKSKWVSQWTDVFSPRRGLSCRPGGFAGVECHSWVIE